MHTAFARKITIKLKLKIQLRINESAISDEYNADASPHNAKCSIAFISVSLIPHYGKRTMPKHKPLGHKSIVRIQLIIVLLTGNYY